MQIYQNVAITDWFNNVLTVVDEFKTYGETKKKKSIDNCWIMM